jgi:hypothetical protein
MQKLVEDTGADELIVVTDTYHPEDRMRSYQRVAGIANSIEVSSAAVAL